MCLQGESSTTFLQTLPHHVAHSVAYKLDEISRILTSVWLIINGINAGCHHCPSPLLSGFIAKQRNNAIMMMIVELNRTFSSFCCSGSCAT